MQSSSNYQSNQGPFGKNLGLENRPISIDIYISNYDSLASMADSESIINSEKSTWALRLYNWTSREVQNGAVDYSQITFYQS